MEMKKYSLWFMPTGRAYDTLVEIISRISLQYSTPKFEPHVTIIPDVVSNENQIIFDTLQLVQLTRPFRIILGKVEYSDEYFKCVFARAKPKEILITANSEARKIFNHQDLTYKPHLSLAYGNLPEQTKKEIVQVVGRELNVAFDVHSIHIIDSYPEVHKWNEIKELQLKD